MFLGSLSDMSGGWIITRKSSKNFFMQEMGRKGR